MPRRNIEVADETWRAVKAKAAMRGQTITDFFNQVLEEALNTDTKPYTGSGPTDTWTPTFRPVPKKGK